MDELRRELAANRDMLVELRNKHLDHCAAVVLAIVQKRIEAADAVLFRTAGVKESLTTGEAATVKDHLTVQMTETAFTWLRRTPTGETEPMTRSDAIERAAEKAMEQWDRGRLCALDMEEVRAAMALSPGEVGDVSDGVTLIAAIASDCSYRTFREMLSGTHCGDCTGAPQTCMRCLAEKRIEVARRSLSQWAER